MPIQVKHSKVSTIPDDANTDLVRPSDWNADHSLVGTIDVPNGGTGATTLTGYVKGNGTAAMTATATIPSGDVSGLGTIATQNANAVTITGGTINGTPIGATTPSTVNATTITGQTGVLRGTGQNLFQQSQTFTNAYWSKSATTVTASATTAPDSTNTASALVETASTGTHLIFTASNPTFPSSVAFTVSIFAKANTRNWLVVNPSTPGVANNETYFDLTNGVLGNNAAGNTSTITSVGSGWYRCTVTRTATSSQTAIGMIFGLATGNGTNSYTGDGTSGLFIWGAQVELGSTANTYIPTTTTAVYGTPTLSFSGVSTIGLESNGALFVQPAGTGALQAQATTSTTAGGNARGANAVDWSTGRAAAARVASAAFGVIGGGYNNSATGFNSTTAGGESNQSSGVYAFIGGGASLTASGVYSVATGGRSNSSGNDYSVVIGGYLNSSSGVFNFIGGGQSNSGTLSSAVTTQSATMNATTAVTLSGSNANIRVGQLVTGTSIASFTYVAAISGTSLTLSQAASGSSTSTLSFFTPHGVVVGGGNNQATGSYSFIGGGGDAGTAANRNVASGDYAVVVGGRSNTASNIGAVVVGGGLNTVAGVAANTASGIGSFIGSGFSNTASSTSCFIGAGAFNTASAGYGTIAGGRYGTDRGINGNTIFPACVQPIASASGVSQAALLVLGVQTTDATATALRSDTSAAGTTNQVILPNNSAYFFRGEVVSGVTGGGNTKGWTIEGVIKRGANAASTALVGTPTVTSSFADAGASAWTIAVTADTTNGGLRVTFTGQAGTTIRVVCQLRTTEMTY